VRFNDINMMLDALGLRDGIRRPANVVPVFVHNSLITFPWDDTAAEINDIGGEAKSFAFNYWVYTKLRELPCFVLCNKVNKLPSSIPGAEKALPATWVSKSGYSSYQDDVYHDTFKSFGTRFTSLVINKERFTPITTRYKGIYTRIVFSSGSMPNLDILYLNPLSDYFNDGVEAIIKLDDDIGYGRITPNLEEDTPFLKNYRIAYKKHLAYIYASKISEVYPLVSPEKKEKYDKFLRMLDEDPMGTFDFMHRSVEGEFPSYFVKESNEFDFRFKGLVSDVFAYPGYHVNTVDRLIALNKI